MLPARHRLKSASDFAMALRTKGRVQRGAKLLVVVLAPIPQRADELPRVGFIVSKTVGNAVVRNQVKRRLRSVVTRHLPLIPPGVDVIVRANPQAAMASSAVLEAAFSHLLRAALRKLEPTQGGLASE